MADTFAHVRANDFRQKRLGCLIAMKDAVFATFLIVQDELNRDAGLIWPVGLGRGVAIANQIARIILVAHFCLSCLL